MKFLKFPSPLLCPAVSRLLILPFCGALCFAAPLWAQAKPASTVRLLGGPIMPAPNAVEKIVEAAPVASPASSTAQNTTLAQAGGLLGGALAKPPNVAEADQAAQIDPNLNTPTIDVSAVRRLRVGGAPVPETPMPVGKLDVLAPISAQFQKLGITVTRVAPENIPSNLPAPADDVYFQLNLPGDDAPPVVMAVGKRVAYIDKVEKPLSAPPFVIKDKVTKEDKLWLPILSIAPLIGAAPRLAPDGTLHLNPTIQSVELFMVKGVPALTIKTSAPIPDGGPLNGGPQIGTIDNPDRIYIDFPGYALGFDADQHANTALGVLRFRRCIASACRFVSTVSRHGARDARPQNFDALHLADDARSHHFRNGGFRSDKISAKRTACDQFGCVAARFDDCRRCRTWRTRHWSARQAKRREKSRA